MDNLTHTMFGVVLSRAGINRVAPQATLTLLLAANAPDVDIVTRLWGSSLTYLKYHRGPTHSLAGLPVIAGLVAAAVWLLTRPGKSSGPPGGFRWGRTYLVALLGVASHSLMDFTNVYGVRPWSPFSDSWYSWDILFVVDAWVWAALAVCLAGPGLGRLISGEIGAQPNTGQGAAVLALIFLVLWVGGRDLLHRRAAAILEAHSYGPESALAPPVRVAAFPAPTSPLAWRGFVETEGFYQIVNFSVFQPFDPTRGQIFYKPENSPALEAALRTPAASQFARFARYRWTTVERREDGYRVVFTDFRFRSERPNAFVCTVELDRELRVIREHFSF